MTNKIEILRSIIFNKEDADTIQNLSDEFTDKDIEFMIEFKKIYELGLTQLKKFLDKLEEEGKELDTYSINYYVSILTNGPLGSYVREMTKDKKYFVNTPDTIGTLGNINKAPQNNTIFTSVGYSLGCAVDTYNKLPNFIQTTLEKSIKITEDTFRDNLKSSSQVDNTKPIIDKQNQTRYNEEERGFWALRSNGSYMVKDSFYYISVKDSSQDVFENVKEYLGDEDFRIYKDDKEFSPFDSEKNPSTSTNFKIDKEYTEGDKKEIITTDLMGDVFDSEENRTTALKISNPNKDEEFLLNTNQGQLGN